MIGQDGEGEGRARWDMVAGAIKSDHREGHGHQGRRGTKIVTRCTLPFTE